MPPDGPVSGPARQAPRGTALISDDDEFFRMALQTVLKKHLEFEDVIETSSIDDAVEELTRAESVELVLFDLNMPGMNNWAALRTVRESFPGAVVAVVSGSRRAEDVLMALSAGVHGYAYKGAGVGELTAALDDICRGSVYVPPSLPQMALELEREAPHAGSGAPEGAGAAELDEHELQLLRQITRRQKEVLDMLVHGRSNKEMARTLDLSEGAVKFHVSALFRRLGVVNRTEAAAAGVRLLGTRGAVETRDANGIIY